MRRIISLAAWLLFALGATAQQNWKFAHVSDTHISNETTVEDLKRTVADINANQEIEFVIISGDITEFGSDEELKLAKSILDGFNKPWYIVPGNHDTNWSESGGNSFRTIFGSETFAFKAHGYLFAGTNCGPNMRMSPGQVPRENVVWLDSVLKATSKETPLIFVNHYPQNNALNNWYEIIDRLKTHNTQLILCGHGHANGHLNFEGIPGFMGRSNLRAKDSVGGYNIVSVKADSVFYNERLPGVRLKQTWGKEKLTAHDFSDSKNYPRPSYEANERFSQVKTKWSVQDDSDIGAGSAIAANLVVVPNTSGYVKAYSVKNGKMAWATKTDGKIYSTPASSGNYIVVASTDKYLYCLDKQTGKIIWKSPADKPVVASPAINKGKVFCGGSDGHFRSYDLASGKLNWDFAAVKGFVVACPLLYNGKIYFGSWGNTLYCLDQQSGKLVWKWEEGANRMFSPASCYPVATSNRLFIVAPDRYMTCFDANTGKVIWRTNDPKIRVRESMGLSADSSLVYVKTMEGDVLGMDAQANSMAVKWRGDANMGYDISPSIVQEHGGKVFALGNSGDIYAFNRKDGSLAWIHKISNSLVNPISFVNDNELIGTTMDGKIMMLNFK